MTWDIFIQSSPVLNPSVYWILACRTRPRLLEQSHAKQASHRNRWFPFMHSSWYGNDPIVILFSGNDFSRRNRCLCMLSPYESTSCFFCMSGSRTSHSPHTGQCPAPACASMDLDDGQREDEDWRPVSASLYFAWLTASTGHLLSFVSAATASKQTAPSRLQYIRVVCCVCVSASKKRGSWH
jgi:hypothetical protein